MQLSLTTLVERLDDLFFERANRAFRLASGIQADAPVIAELPEVSRIDAFTVTSELLESPRVDEAKHDRLVLLRRYLARAFIEAQTESANSSLEKFLSTHQFAAASRQWTPHEAVRELPRLAAREMRISLAPALSSVMVENQSLVARRLDTALEAAAALKLNPVTLVETVHGRPLAPRLDEARVTLSDTQDASADLLAYGLKKLDPTLTLKTASTHDIDRVALAPWLFELFRREELPHALSRCLEDLGLSPNAEGRLTIDSEPRTGRDLSPRAFELRVPGQIRVLLTPEMGFDGYAGWLSTWGIALHRANVGRTLPFVERRLGDRAVIDAVGLFFESFLLDEGWLKRYLRLTNNQAKEAVRAFASRQLLELRRSAAIALYSFQALNEGRWNNLAEMYVPQLSSALGVPVHQGHALFAIDLFGDQLVRLDAFALEHTMRRHLQERFNEDFWRNPATGRWLLDLASRGQRDDAVTVGKELATPPATLHEAAQHRVELMGA